LLENLSIIPDIRDLDWRVSRKLDDVGVTGIGVIGGVAELLRRGGETVLKFLFLSTEVNTRRWRRIRGKEQSCC